MNHPVVAPRQVTRVRHELRVRELTVVDVARTSPGFISVTLAGEALADFPSASFDDHVKLLLPDEGGEPVRREYTPRRYSRAERTLTIDFAVHGAGSADRWSRQAAVGQTLTVGGPRGSMVVPVDFDWHLLIGDAAAVPAIARRLDELPTEARALVVVQLPEDDRCQIAARAGATIVHASTPDALLAAVRRLALPAGEGYAWAAGEATLMVQVRRVLIEELGHPRGAMRVASYWKHGAADHHETLTD